MADRITVDGAEYELVEGSCEWRECDLCEVCARGGHFTESGMSACLLNKGHVWQKCDPSAITVDTAYQQCVTCASTEGTEPMPKADTITETDMIAAAALIRQCRAKADDYRTAVIKRNLIAVWNGYATVIERLLAIAGGKALTCDGCQRLAHRSVLPACQTCRRMPRQDMFSTCEKTVHERMMR